MRLRSYILRTHQAKNVNPNHLIRETKPLDLYLQWFQFCLNAVIRMRLFKWNMISIYDIITVNISARTINIIWCKKQITIQILIILPLLILSIVAFTDNLHSHYYPNHSEYFTFNRYVWIASLDKSRYYYKFKSMPIILITNILAYDYYYTQLIVDWNINNYEMSWIHNFNRDVLKFVNDNNIRVMSCIMSCRIKENIAIWNKLNNFFFTTNS